MVLLRFAPSPTGPLHLGSLRTALYNHLYSRKLGGKWLLRIEDTDSARYVPGSVDGIKQALAWAGLDYDYGPDKPGRHAPYHQSERLDLYHTYASKLLENNHAYRCFCSQDRLATTREGLARKGSNKTYDKACLGLTEEEVVRRLRAGEKFVVRFNDSNLPPPQRITDLVFGPLKDAHASLPTDPILLKSDNFPTYHLASVVDDHEMEITHVVRGEEWLPSLPLHLDLYSALDVRPPQFAHLPILLNPDGTKMSKRKGDVQVIDFIHRGWEPDALLNWLSLAGWGVDRSAPAPTPSTSTHSPIHNPAPDSTTVFTLPELIASFDLHLLTHRRPLLDPLKLEYLNKHHVMRLASTPDGLRGLAERVHDKVKEAFPGSQWTEISYLQKVIELLQTRLKTMNDIPSAAPYLFVRPDYTTEEAKQMAAQIPSKDLYGRISRALHERLSEADPASWTDGHLDLSAILHEERDLLLIKGGTYMGVLRHALTGMMAGPSIADTMRLLGKDRSLQRLKDGFEHFQQTR